MTGSVDGVLTHILTRTHILTCTHTHTYTRVHPKREGPQDLESRAVRRPGFPHWGNPSRDGTSTLTHGVRFRICIVE